MQDEVISEDEIQVARRGRKPSYDAKLLATLAALKPGKAIRLGGTFGVVEQERRQAVGAAIRKHWTAAREDSCRINFGTDGIPQVSVKA